jgi:hypothetical protein
MASPGPRPSGPEKVMPQEWGSDKEMRCALPSGDPTNRSGEALGLPGMWGGGHYLKPKDVT